MEPIQIADLIRDSTHNLDLSNTEDKGVFDVFLRQILRELEGSSLSAYDDKRPIDPKNHTNLIHVILANGEKVLGNVTVGVGCNMDASGSAGSKGFKKRWEELLDASFDDVYYGRTKITKDEETILLNNNIDETTKKIEDQYKEVWDIFRPNEKLAILVAGFQGDKIVGDKTNFYKNMALYAKTGNKNHLQEAVTELKERSNRDKIRGITTRRSVEAAILDSTQCPFYVFGAAKNYPTSTQIVYAQRTRIPRSVTRNIPVENESKYCVWRTRLDDKVRKEHLNKEGLIFNKDMPNIKLPGEDYNCRCWEENLPSNFKILEHKAMFYFFKNKTCT